MKGLLLEEQFRQPTQERKPLYQDTRAVALTETQDSSDLNNLECFVFFHVQVGQNGTSLLLKAQGLGSFHWVASPTHFFNSYPTGQNLMTLPPTAGDACALRGFCFYGRSGEWFWRNKTNCNPSQPYLDLVLCS